MRNKQSQKLKRIVSGLLSLSMITSMSAVLPANAEEENKQGAYPYAVFAADEQGGITLNLDYLTVNGNGVTNGVYSTTAMYPNINGTISENEFVIDEIVTDDENTTDAQENSKPFDVSKDMIYIHNKLMDSWFNNAQNYAEDYSLSEMNINLNSPVYVTGKLNYEGNISLNSAIGAVSDVNLSGGNLNGNNAVIYSKFGDIKITDRQASMNGLIYAPFGTVTIDCDNFNLNGLIIAQNVVVNSNGANINYNNSWAEFVGTETEELSWTFADWKYLADTDEDGLPNLVEKEIGTKPYEADTDGDLLPDGYEVLSLGTDPLKVDTDDNDISDYDEDFDTDGLSNGQEYEIGTRPFDDDSDGDSLKDGDEVNTYFTDPLEVDTDKDGLNDDDEIYFGTDPNDPDSDDNNILDGDEKRSQTFIHRVENKDCAITEVIVSMEATGNLQKTTSIESLMNVDMLCTRVAGLVGEPFSIETTSDYEKATLTYVIDKSKLGDVEFDNLMFLWYNEKEDSFVELETILDKENSTVSINTPHFSRYMIVDREKWFDAWSVEFNYRPSDSGSSFRVTYDTVIAIDCSGSMFDYDTTGINSNRAKAVENFLNTMRDGDRAAIINFSGNVNSSCALTEHTDLLKNELYAIKSSGGTSFYYALSAALEMFDSNDSQPINKRIILLSDGEDSIPYDVLDSCNQRHIPVYTIGLGSRYNTILGKIADYTGGKAFDAYTSDQLLDIYSKIGLEADFDTTDTDGDGLYDAVEAAGIRLQNGDIIYDCDPNDPDSDDDFLKDGEEINPIPIKGEKGYYFKIISDPLNPDSDYDYYLDGKDTFRYFWNSSKIYDEDIDDSDSAYGNNPLLNSDNNSNGTLRRTIMGDNGTQYKNEYVFERSNSSDYVHNGYTSQFSLKPERESFYAFTITNVTSVDDVEIKITYVNERLILSDQTIKVEQYSAATYDSNNHTATFYYLLEPDNDTAYKIKINNNTGCDTYEVRVSQDNWVYAEYGAVCTAHEEPSIFDSSDYKTVYISSKGLYEIINHYCMAVYEDPSITYEEFINRTDTGVKDESSNPFYATCIRNESYLNAGQVYGDQMVGTVNNIIGSAASITGVLLLIPISSKLAAVVTVIGGVSAVGGIEMALFDAHVEAKRTEFIDAMYEGKDNFYIYNLVSVNTFMTYDRQEFKSFHPWNGTNNYVNKIVLNTIYNVKPLTVTAYEELEDGTWRVVS